MIAEREFKAVFRATDGRTYLQVPVIAWSDEGLAMVAHVGGYLVAAMDRPGFLGVWIPSQDGMTRAKFGAQFREQWDLGPGGNLQSAAAVLDE